MAHLLPSSYDVMRLSETITIYLAAGAPFGVNYFLHKQHGMISRYALLKATGAMLLWPLTAVVILLNRLILADAQETLNETENAIHERASEKIAQARRELLASLYRAQEMAHQALVGRSEKVERAVCVLRESIEKYVGLTMTTREIAHEAPPGEREIELCRVAGRTGDDLLLAGHCIHRRNVARLFDHRQRARTDFLHALAELREHTDGMHSVRLTNAVAARHFSVAILKLYGQAINLLSLLEDQNAARGVARLLDAECARLRRLESFSLEFPYKRVLGEGRWRTPTSHPANSHLSQKRTPARG